MDQFNRTTKRHAEAVIDGKDYSVRFTLGGQVCQLHRHFQFPVEKWTSISASSPRFALLRKRIETLSEETI